MQDRQEVWTINVKKSFLTPFMSRATHYSRRSAMYIVAFGDDPPTSLARFVDSSLESTTLDATMSTSFYIAAEGATVDVEYDGSVPLDDPISLITIKGTMTISMDSLITQVPVVVEIQGGEENFRIVAPDVKLKSLLSTISHLAPKTLAPSIFVEGDR